MGGISKVKPGDPFKPSAELHNATVDVITRNKLRGPMEGGYGSGPTSSALKVFVHNTTGGAVDPLKYYGLSDSLFDPATATGAEYDTPTLEIAEYDSELHGSAIGVLRGPIANDGIGEAWIMGLVWAEVDVSDADHKFAATETGETTLQSAGSGSIRIVWKASGTGVKKCVVSLGGGGSGGAVVFYGTMNEDYTAGPTDMDVTIDRVIGLDEIPSAADVSWNNDHAKLVDIDDEVTGTGYLDDTGKWQVRIIEYDEEFYMCADDAMVVDGGDVDDLYPYGSAPGNAYPYGAD